MNRKRFLLYLGIALSAFIFGTIVTTLWNSHSGSRSQTSAVRVKGVEEEWPLNQQIVSRSLQSRSFRTDRLPRNSDEEIIWRWLKVSIEGYPQNWVKLNISDNESYGVVLYPPKVLESTELPYYNKELNDKGLPLLAKDKRYLPINVYHGNIICPSWSGFIDVEEAKLVYFAGSSG